MQYNLFRLIIKQRSITSTTKKFSLTVKLTDNYTSKQALNKCTTENIKQSDGQSRTTILRKKERKAKPIIQRKQQKI